MISKLASIIIIHLLILETESFTFEEDISLTLQQKILLDEFKLRVSSRLTKDYMKTELYLVNWLRPSRFNLDLAEQRLNWHLRWRKRNKMDTIQDEDWSDMYDDVKYHTGGRDKLGRPYLLIEAKDIDIRKVILQGKGERYLRYVDKGVEEACQLVYELGEKYGNFTRGNTLYNLDGFNVAQHVCPLCMPYLMRALISVLEHWPGCLDKSIVVRAPSTVENAVKIFVSLVSEEIRGNIHIYGTNKNVWMTALLKDFDLAELPPSLGGTKIFEGMDE